MGTVEVRAGADERMRSRTFDTLTFIFGAHSKGVRSFKDIQLSTSTMKVAFEASSGRIPPPSLLQEQQREQRSRGVRHPSHGRTLQRRRYAHQYMLACYCILAVAFLKSDYSRCRSSVGSGARRNHSVWVEAAGVATTTRQSTESDDESTPNKRRDREKDTQQARSKQENSKSSSSSSSSSSRQEQNHNDQSGNRNGDKSDDDNDSPNGSFELVCVPNKHMFAAFGDSLYVAFLSFS
jgi:hypothetical protein